MCLSIVLTIRLGAEKMACGKIVAILFVVCAAGSCAGLPLAQMNDGSPIEHQVRPSAVLFRVSEITNLFIYIGTESEFRAFTATFAGAATNRTN